MEFFTYRIADVFDRFSSGKNITEEKISDSGQYPVYGGNGLRGYTNTSNFNGECILIGRQGAKCGNVRYFNGEGYMTDHAIVGVCKSSHNTQFMNYALASLNLNRLSGQAAQPGLSVGMLKKQKILLPSLENQTKIANIIFGYNNVIENNNKRIAILEQMAENLYKEWFVRFRFPGHENVKFENGIPKGWEYKILADFVTFNRGISYSSEEIDCDDGTTLINLKNIEAFGGFRRDGSKKYNGKYKDTQVVKPYDLIMGITDMTQDRRTVGAVALIPELSDTCVISADLLKINSEVDNIFLYCLCRYGYYSKFFSQFANGANVLHLRPNALLNKKILIPDTSIITHFVEQIKPTIVCINKVHLANENLIKQRDLLLPRLMSGKLEV